MREAAPPSNRRGWGMREAAPPSNRRGWGMREAAPPSNRRGWVHFPPAPALPGTAPPSNRRGWVHFPQHRRFQAPPRRHRPAVKQVGLGDAGSRPAVKQAGLGSFPPALALQAGAATATAPPSNRRGWGAVEPAGLGSFSPSTGASGRCCPSPRRGLREGVGCRGKAWYTWEESTTDGERHDADRRRRTASPPPAPALQAGAAPPTPQHRRFQAGAALKQDPDLERMAVSGFRNGLSGWETTGGTGASPRGFRIRSIRSP